MINESLMIRYVLILALTASLIVSFPANATIACCNYCADQYQQEGPYPYFEVIRTQRQLLDDDVVAGAGWKRIFESCAQVNRVNVTASQDVTVVARAFLQLNDQTTPGVVVEYRWLLDDVPVGMTFHFRAGRGGFPHGDDINIVLPNVAAGAHRVAIEGRALAESGRIKFRLLFVTAQGFPSRQFPGASRIADGTTAIDADWKQIGPALDLAPAEATRLYLQSYIAPDEQSEIDFRYVVDAVPLAPFTTIAPVGGGVALFDHDDTVLAPRMHSIWLEARADAPSMICAMQVEAATAPATYGGKLLSSTSIVATGSLGRDHQPLNCLILSAAGAGGTGGLGGTPACGKYDLLFETRLGAAALADDYTIFGDGSVEIENPSATNGLVTLAVEAIYEDSRAPSCNTLIDTPDSACADPAQCSTADFSISEFGVPPGRTQKFFFVDPVHWGSSFPNHIRLWARSQDGCGATAVALTFGRSRLSMQLVPAGLGSCFSAREQGRAAAPLVSVATSTGKAVLQWETSQTINGFWDVLRAAGDGAFTQIVRLGSSVRTFTDTSVRAGVSYRYEVRAFAFSTDPTLAFGSVCGAPSDAMRVTIPPIAPRRRASSH